MEMVNTSTNGKVLPKEKQTTTNAYNSIIDTLNELPYVSVATCAYMHILTTKNLKPKEKLLWIICDLRANIELNSPNKTNIRRAQISASQLAEWCNISRRSVFNFSKNMIEQGYLLVQSGGTDEKNRHQRNMYETTFPESTLKSLSNEPDRHSTENSGKKACSNRQDLDETKLFTMVSFFMFKNIISRKELSANEKVLWIYSYFRGYIAHKKSNDFIFHEPTVELANKLNIRTSTLKNSIINLQEHGLIFSETFKVDGKNTARKELEISALCASIPQATMEKLKLERARKKSKQTFVSSVPHDLQNIHHGNKENSPHISIKTPNKNIVKENKDCGVSNPNSTEEKNSFQLKTEEELKIRANEVYCSWKQYLAKAEKANLDLNYSTQSFGQRLSHEDKDTLTRATHFINKKIEGLVDEHKGLASVSFEAFLSSNLEESELFFWKEQQSMIGAVILDLELLQKLSIEISEVESEVASQSNEEKRDFVEDLTDRVNESLSTDEKKHIKNYLCKLRKKDHIKGDAKNKSFNRLLAEVSSYFSVMKLENKTYTNQIQKRIKKLEVIGGLLAQGKWKIPAPFLEADRAQISFNTAQERKKFN